MKFLIVKLSSLGDIIHALPIIYKLRKNYPKAQIDWLVGEKGIELLSLIKEINTIYKLNSESMKKIRKEKYDYVIDVQGLFKTGFYSRLAFGKKVIGFKNTREFADIFYDEKINVGELFNTNDHVVKQNLKLISTFVNPQYLEQDIRFLMPRVNSPDKIEPLSSGNKNKILLLPATTWESKMWPVSYWVELIKSLRDDFEVIVSAAKSDEEVLKPLIKFLQENEKTKNYIGKTNINDLIYLIQNVNLVIGLDSGGFHLAGAINNDYGSPNVMGIYGPTSIYRNGPFNTKITSILKNVIYRSALHCLPCRKKKCPLTHHNCMNELKPEKILKMAKSQLVDIGSKI